MKQYNDFSKLIHREGYIFVVVFAAATFLLSTFHSSFFWLGLILTFWCGYFFRNPERVTPIKKGLVVSPADGIVQKIIECKPPTELEIGDSEMIRVSIFLNIFNVHVNRIPASGKILALHYNPGKFFNASLDKASIYNERQSVVMETETGNKIAFVQIAGLIARRIVCDLEEGNQVNVGERYGIIRFGSRVDIYLPLNIRILVAEGQTCIGGETIIADFDPQVTKQLRFERR